MVFQYILLVILFFNTSATDEQRCSIFSSAIHDDVGKEVSLHNHMKSANKEYWYYKPEIAGNDYAKLKGWTQQLTIESFKKDSSFEFCARYKGALTHFNGRFYCCGGTSAYHFEEPGHDIKSEKNFLPCFHRSAATVEAEKVKFEFSSERNSSLEPEGWSVLYGDNMIVYDNLMYTSGRHSSSEMTEMPVNESDTLTADRLAGTVVYGMYQHFIQLKNRLFLVNHRNRVFETNPESSKFVEIETGDPTLHDKNFYRLRDRLMCTIMQDSSKYVCLVHDLTDGVNKEDRRRRVLHYILEVWSLDEKEKPVFQDYPFPFEKFEKEDIHVNQMWPYIEPVENITFENDWKEDIVAKYAFKDDTVKGTDGESYTSNLTGKKFSDLVVTLWDDSVWGMKLTINDTNTMNYKLNKNLTNGFRKLTVPKKIVSKCSQIPAHEERRNLNSLSGWWRTYGLCLAYPHLFGSNGKTRTENKLEYNNFKRTYPNLFYKFWTILDVPAVIGFEACTPKPKIGNVEKTTFKIRMKKSFDRADLDKIYKYARGGHSMNFFTNFLNAYRNGSEISEEDHQQMNEMANECYLGKHKNFHTVTHVMDSAELKLNIDQCQNLCEKNTDSWEDHILLDSARTWELDNHGKAEVPVKNLHSGSHQQTVCNWGNNPSIRFRSIVIKEEFIGLKGCWPDQKSFAEKYWPLDNQQNTTLATPIIEFIKNIFDVYKVNQEPFKNKLYNIQTNANTKHCQFDPVDIRQPNQSTSVAWVLTIGIGIITVLTILWNFDDIIYKMKFKAFTRKVKIEKSKYTVMKMFTKGNQATTYMVKNNETGIPYVAKFYPPKQTVTQERNETRNSLLGTEMGNFDTATTGMLSNGEQHPFAMDLPHSSVIRTTTTDFNTSRNSNTPFFSGRDVDPSFDFQLQSPGENFDTKPPPFSNNQRSYGRSLQSATSSLGVDPSDRQVLLGPESNNYNETFQDNFTSAAPQAEFFDMNNTVNNFPGMDSGNSLGFYDGYPSDGDHFMNTNYTDYTASTLLSVFQDSGNTQTFPDQGSIDVDLSDVCKYHDTKNKPYYGVSLATVFEAWFIGLGGVLRRNVPSFNGLRLTRRSESADSPMPKSENKRTTISDTKTNSSNDDKNPKYFKDVFETELQILALTQSDFVPGVVEYYSNISKIQKTFLETLLNKWRKKKCSRSAPLPEVGGDSAESDQEPRLCYYMMSMEGDSCWEHHVKNPNNKEIQTTSTTPLNIGRLKTGVFDVKAHLTVQVLKALQTFQQVDKYTFATKILNKEYDMHPRCICHSDLHFDNILVSKGEVVYTTYEENEVTEKEFMENNYLRDIADIKVIIIDFGKGIIVKNRFETYKDYFDVENLLRKLWFGEHESGNSVEWNSATQEFEWLLSEQERVSISEKRVDLDLVGDMKKVRIMQTLLSSFMKIKKGMQHLYENNCESPEFRDYRKQEKGRKQREKVDKKLAAKNQGNVTTIGAQGDIIKQVIDVGVKGYNKEVGPNVLLPGDSLTERVDESTLEGYDLKDVENAQKYSFKHVGEIINKYQTDMAKLKKRK